MLIDHVSENTLQFRNLTVGLVRMCNRGSLDDSHSFQCDCQNTELYQLSDLSRFFGQSQQTRKKERANDRE